RLIGRCGASIIGSGSTTPRGHAMRVRHLLAAVALILFAGSAIAAEAPNIIVRENQKPGTQDWLLTRTDVDKNERSRSIEGFCSHTSLRAGDELTVFVSMNPAGRFQLDVYRMGYYG